MSAAPLTIPGTAEARILSNGRYRVLVSIAGAGSSQLGRWTLTRYTEDPVRDPDGWFFYLRDLDAGHLWSAGHQPVQHPPVRYEARLGEQLVTLEREDTGIVTRTDIWVDRQLDLEWRRLTLTNRGAALRRLEVTSYVEVALNTPAADAGHPAFSKLFVQTEYVPGIGALLAMRRPRSPEEHPPVLGHAMVLTGDAADPDYETDRARFIGRGRSLAGPRALTPGASLSRTVGNVLDPILSLRREIALPPGASVVLHGVLAAAADREETRNLLRLAPELRAGTGIPMEKLTVSHPIEREDSDRYRPADGVEARAAARETLRFDNSLGGFSEAGDEYVIRIDRTPDGLRLPPQPWTNVVASPTTGFVASERGLGFSWTGNSRRNRLTPWFNDPVCDPAGEALYLRDEDRGVFWSPTPGPVPGSGAYEVRHGFGWTSWRHESQDLLQEVLAFVPLEDPVKLVRLRVSNTASRPRRISLFAFAEWVLGERRSEESTSLVTEAVGDTLIIATTSSSDAGGRTAFAAAGGPCELGRSLSADRAAFLGRWGSTERPRALRRDAELNGRTGAGLDPCAAFQLTTSIPPGGTGEWTLLLGEAENRTAAFALAERYRNPDAVAAAFAAVAGFWRDLLGGVHSETPSPALDLLLNGWLAYQNLSCRLWARSAFYQSGGAFGFRDQLQDAAALLPLRPSLTREQILLHAAHQFEEGDVLHWWHPPDGPGLRTRFSDDLLWLPYVTLHYLETSGDDSMLAERVRWLAARELEPGEDEALLLPVDSGRSATLYEHCCRALDRSLTRGPHGLPLIGSGDWNDGMNRVGRLGRGESVWLGFFLHTILERFSALCARRGDPARVTRYREYLTGLVAALQGAGWDGAWYRRGYYDDGAPLGSAESDECRIDALAQAWAVLSGVAPPERAAAALNSLERFLIDEPTGLIRLLTPPFDTTPHDPGYIKGYLPGVRENGGQYTHAALWVVSAMARAGRCERAAELLELLNPIRHGDSAKAVATYQIEPYVVAADVYGVEPHVGRGGWSWYTGSAGWMFRVALESILGVTLRDGRQLVIRPCIPASWPGFTLRYRLPDGQTLCEIAVRRGGGPSRVEAGGLAAWLEDGAALVALPGDGGRHRIVVTLGTDSGPGKLTGAPVR